MACSASVDNLLLVVCKCVYTYLSLSPFRNSLLFCENSERARETELDSLRTVVGISTNLFLIPSRTVLFQQMSLHLPCSCPVVDHARERERFQKLVLIDWIRCFYIHIFFLAVGCWCTLLCCCSSSSCYSPLLVVHCACLSLFSFPFLTNLLVAFVNFSPPLCVRDWCPRSREEKENPDHLQKWNRNSIQ